MTVKIDTLRCTGCGACTLICPVGALWVDDMKCRVSEECIDCGQCIDACTWQAITMDEETSRKKSK